MAKIKEIWIEEDKSSIRCDWDNDRHQRMEIDSGEPLQVIIALKRLASLLEAELEGKHI